MDEWKKQVNSRPYLSIIIILVVLVLFGWLHYDTNRNDGINHDTDGTVADIDKRIQSIEGRLDSMQTRLDENQKAVSRIAEGIGKSTSLAETVASGIQGTEDRIDQAIQRSGRIANIIAEIERTNK